MDDMIDHTGAGGTEGGIEQADEFSDDSNASDLDASSSDENAIQNESEFANDDSIKNKGSNI